MRRRPENGHDHGNGVEVTPVHRNPPLAPTSDTPKHRNGPHLDGDEKKQEFDDVEHGNSHHQEYSSTSSRHQDQQSQQDHSSLYIPRLPGTTTKRFKYKQSDSSLPDGNAEGSSIPIQNSTWRTRRKRRRSSSAAGTRVCDCLSGRKSTTTSLSISPDDLSENTKLIIAVLLWYSLGVVSISTSKLLLTPYHVTDQPRDDDNHYIKYWQHVGGLPPLFLTLQQLMLGCTFLRFLLSIHFLKSPGLKSMETILTMAGIYVPSEKHNKKRDDSEQTAISNHHDDHETSEFQLLWQALRPSASSESSNSTTTTLWYLLKAGICFSLGFYTTNLAFRTASSPAFVETVKAAEPITSAILAVTWGIDTMTPLEVVGLAGIITGVLLSTSASSSNHHSANAQTTMTALLIACGIVMTSNLCFSLRGLYQKLFRRATAAGSNAKATAPSTTSTNKKNEPNLTTQQQTQTPQLDDLNLQFRMQQTGVCLLVVPTLLWQGPSLLNHVLRVADVLSTRQFLKVLMNYFILATINGLAFSSYNLASTYILTRVSVVHHAALNCTRRIFAIVCTSILFMTPITYLKAFGITVSFLSFMVFTYAKTTKNSRATAVISSSSKRSSNDAVSRSKI